MGRNLDPKSKQERREGVNLFLKGEKNFSPKNPVVKRLYPPGMHGPTSRTRLSGYGTRLREKQKAKKIYRLLERQFRNYFFKASQTTGDTAQNLVRLLETRLDNVVYRLGLAASRDQARQLVNHGHFLVNGKRVSIPSYQARSGDIITVKPLYLKKRYWQEMIPKFAKVETPGWLTFDSQKIEGKVVALPAGEDLTVPFESALIVEFYSR